MYPRNTNYSHTDYDDYSETDGYDEDEDDDDCIILNYNDFINTNEYPDEDCDSDEKISSRHDYSYEQYDVSDSTSKSAAQGKHSCLKLKDGYCYLDPSVYDTRVMRNLSTMDDNHLFNGNYSPKFIQAALEKTESLTSWDDDSQANDSMYYNNQQLDDSDEDYYDYYHKTKQPVQGEELKAMVENLIYDTQVVIFSKTYCPYCITAKEIFDDLDQPYTTVELDQRTDGDQIQEIMGEITGGKSVPRVFINGIFIGGGDDVKSLYESGELQQILDIE